VIEARDRTIDARTLNWRFLLPDEPEGILLLPVADERVPGAIVPDRDPGALMVLLEGRRYPAVVATDAAAWSAVAGRGAARLLARLADAVEPGGSIYVGFANPWYPAAPRSRGSLGLRRIQRILGERGLVDAHAFVALPDQACPAYLVDAVDPACLEHFIRRLAVPHAEMPGLRGRVRQGLLMAMRLASLVAPHAMRVRLAPATAVVARRPR